MNFVNVFDQLPNIAQIVRRCPTITLSRAYVRAYREFCDQTRWLVVNIDGATEEDVAQYNLGSDPLLEILAVRAVQGTYTPPSGTAQSWGLAASDPTKWDANRQPAQPMVFTYVPHGQIALYPTPDKVYTLKVAAVVQPKSEAVTQVPDQCLVQYSNEIEAGALGYLLAIPGQPWTNPVEALRFRKEFQSGIANGKAAVQRQFNMGSQRVRALPYIR